MNFQDLRIIEKSQVYTELAIRKADTKANLLRSTIKLKSVTKTTKSRRIEIDRLKIITEILCEKLSIIHKGFPSLDALPEFYSQLIKLFLDYDKIKKSLGSVNWAEKQIRKISKDAIIRIKREEKPALITRISNSAVGRICSIVKQVDKFLLVLENARKTMKNFPTIKTSIYTIAIAGFPNVGKSTLLSKLTSSTPEIKDYAFTTKKLNVGYYKKNAKKLQFIDTPGTLARFNKMNPIEKQAFLAMKYCANLIICIFDLSDATYSLIDQDKLFQQIIELDKPIIIYLSKTDTINFDKNKIKDFISKFDKNYKVLSEIDKLIAEIIKLEKSF